MRRRTFVGGALTALLPARRLLAQQGPAKVPRVGILTPASSDKTPIFAAFHDALRQLGYVEGRTIDLEFRFASGDHSLLLRLAEELAARPVDVIVADSTDATVAARKATTSIPIVQAAGLDPTTIGLAASHARPGGNVTGFTLMTTELNAKRLQLLHAIVPTDAAIALLLHPSGATTIFLRETEEAARQIGLRIVARVDPQSPEDLRALTPNAFAGAAGIAILPDPMFWNRRGDIVSLVAATRLPAVYSEREYADDGGLVAYGPNVPDNFRRAAGYIDRILKGAKAAELPIQEPSKFDFVVNQKTAKALGLTLPPLLLAQADEVIE